MNKRINCLNDEELNEILNVNAKFYGLEDIIEQEIKTFNEKKKT